MRAVAGAMPERASLPFVVVIEIDVLVNHGPPTSAAVCPVGAAESGVTVNVAVLEPPALLFAVTVCAPEAFEATVQPYAVVYGLAVTSPPPVIPVSDGNVTR